MGAEGRWRWEQGVSERDLGLGDGLDMGQVEAGSACSRGVHVLRWNTKREGVAWRTNPGFG